MASSLDVDITLGLMVPVRASALPLLLDAAEQETQRLIAISVAMGEDWPEGFDANDIPLYIAGAEATREAMRCEANQIDLAGKALWFLLALIPGYARANKERLSPDELEALREAYSHQASWSKVSFPNLSK